MVEKKTPVGKPADDFIRIQDLWSMFVPKWYWFAISLFITLTIAVLYLLSTPPIYTRTAAILVKDNSKSSSSTGAMSDFSDLGIFKSNTNINNELLTLKSPTLMTEVVNRLGLNETFTIRKGLKNVDLYKVSPVTITFCDKIEVPLSFTIKFSSKEAFAISELEISGEDIGETLSAQMGDSIQTSAGIMIVSPTQEFTDAFIGTSIRYVRGSVRAAVDTYSNALVAELGNEDATIINLSINDTSIRKAEDILNTLIEVYNENWIRDKNQIAVSTSQFISDRLGVIESELGHVDENISSYKSEHLLPDVQAASSLYMAQSAENNKELSTLNNQLSTAQYIRRELNTKQLDQTLPANSGIVSANSGIVSANIETQISEYNNLVLDRNRLIANSSEKNPLVKNMASSLQSMQRTIIQSVDNLIVSLNTQIRSLRRQEEATTNRLASNPNQAKYLLSVERQQKVKEKLYLYLLQKREENELSQAFTAYNTRLITAPRGSMFPTAPRKMNILLVAFAVGLLVPAVGIFMKENMNTKVRGRKDLENLSIPFIGEIPQYSGTKKKWWEFKHRKRQDMKTIVVNEGNRNIINEAFRVLRSNMDFMASKDNNQHVFVLTSFNPGSGKSFLAINIAISFAIKKKKILIIDGDLRHRTVSSYVDSPNKGLSDYLNNQIEDWKEIIVSYKGYTNLHILPIGTIPPNPTELLEDSKLSMLIEALRPEYDYIFIDCPPVDIVADAQIIEKWADRTIFVVRSGLLDRSMLSELENMYTGKRFKNLSMILNGTESTGGRYGYRYGYHYGYASYYGSKDK